jgi:hypothetical protein
VGTVCTEHHQVQLKVKSTLDGCMDDLGTGHEEQEGMMSQHMSTTMCSEGQDLQTEVMSEANDAHVQDQKAILQDTAAARDQQPAPAAENGASKGARLCCSGTSHDAALRLLLQKAL